MPRPDIIHGDRRADRRYSSEMPLRFLCQNGAAQYSGSGYTRDLGRKGICFITEDPLPHAAEVELRIEWPFLLQDVCPLELRVWGQVVRSNRHSTAIQMNKYEFRTCGPRSFDQASDTAATWSIVA